MGGNLLEEWAENFFEKQWCLVQKALPVFDAQPRVDFSIDSNRLTLQLTVPLSYAGKSVSDFELSLVSSSDLYSIYVEYQVGEDPVDQQPTVHLSTFQLRVAESPIIRFEYDRDKTSVPSAHIHVHGTNLLSAGLVQNYKVGGKRKGKRTGVLDELHIPVGGNRFRPTLEDFLYFVIGECGFRSREGWENNLLDHREEWMEAQCRAVVRDSPSIAARELKDLGYEIVASPLKVDESSPHRKVW